MNNHPRRLWRDDTGVTLVELIIIVVIIGLLGGAIAMTFISGLVSQQATAARDLATGRTTVITETLADGIRNSVRTGASSDGKRVDATVLLPNGSFECRAWAINGRDEFVYSSGATRRSSDTSAWGALVNSAELKVSGALGGARAFSSNGSALAIGLQFTAPSGSASSSEAITFQTSVTSQARTESRPPTCF